MGGTGCSSAGVNGHEYLDKIVQIPFVIPQLADDEKAKLCKGYLTSVREAEMAEARLHGRPWKAVEAHGSP